MSYDPFAPVKNELTDPKDTEDTGGFIDKEGKYHLLLTKVKLKAETENERDGEVYETTPHVMLIFKVLHSVPNQSPKGSTYIHKLYVAKKGGEPLSAGGRAFLEKAAYRFGLLVKRGGKIVPADGGDTWSPRDFEDLVGTQKMAEIVLETGADNGRGGKYPDKHTVQYHQFYDVTDPHVDDWPKNETYLAQAASDDVPFDTADDDF